MVSLTEQDYQKTLTFLQRLYDPNNLINFPAYLPEAIPKLIPADVPIYGMLDFQARQGSGAEFPITDFEQIMYEHFHEHPLVTHYLKTFDTQAFKLSDFVSKEQLYRFEGLYQKVMRPLDLEDQLVIILTSPPKNRHTDAVNVSCLALNRSQNDFTERDRLVLTLLGPHLLQACQTYIVLTQMYQEHQQLQHTLDATGSIILSEDGHVQLMTPKAEQLLKQYFTASTNLGRSLPEPLNLWVMFQKSLRSPKAGSLNPHLPLKLEQNDQQLIVRFASDPTKNQYLLLLEEQKIPSLSVASFELLGLSTREAEVLFWVAKGKENPEIAETLCISTTTVRKHLERIYLKLDVKTRTAAVVTALEKLGLIT